MKNTLTILFCLFTLSSFSQDKVHKSKKVKFNWSDDKAYVQVKDTSSDDTYYPGSEDSEPKKAEKCQCPEPKPTRNIYQNGNVANMPTNVMNWFH